MTTAAALESVDRLQLSRLGFRGPDVDDALAACRAASGSPDVLAEVQRLADRLVERIGRVGSYDALHDAAAVGDLDAGVVAVLAALVAAPTVQAAVEARFGEAGECALADLGQQVWVNRITDGRFGCGSYTWLAVVFSGVFCWLGRLQYNLDLVDGEEVVSTHIPQAGPLDPDDVAASLTRAREVFGPDLRIWCNSWLLDPELAAALPPESNMARFQALWELTGKSTEDDDGVLFFAFRRRGAIEPGTLPTETRLHQVLVARWAQGGHWRCCGGFLRPLASGGTRA